MLIPVWSRDPMTDEKRRSFLRWAIHGLSGLFAAILGFPALMYVIDPRHRKASHRNFRPVEGVNLADLEMNVPVQGIIRDTRRDAWTLYPSDVIGRVWVVKHGNRAGDFLVFTTVCPHLGCSVNLAVEGGNATGFLCPCHSA